MLYGGALKFSYSYIASGNTVPTYGSVVKIKVCCHGYVLLCSSCSKRYPGNLPYLRKYVFQDCF